MLKVCVLSVERRIVRFLTHQLCCCVWFLRKSDQLCAEHTHRGRTGTSSWRTFLSFRSQASTAATTVLWTQVQRRTACMHAGACSRTRCLLRLPLHQRLRSTRVHHALCPQTEVHGVRHGITRRATTRPCTDCSALCAQRCRDTAEGPHPEGSEVHPEPGGRPGRGAQVSGATASLRWFRACGDVRAGDTCQETRGATNRAEAGGGDTGTVAGAEGVDHGPQFGSGEAVSTSVSAL